MQKAINCDICDMPVKLIKVKGADSVDRGASPEMETTACQNDHPILSAVKCGDTRKLEGLLKEKKPEASSKERPIYPRDWKYHFEDLLKTDTEGKTVLHLAAGFGDHDTALTCVQLILESHQVCLQEYAIGKENQPEHLIDTNGKLLEFKDKNKNTALILAIENKAVAVVSYLLENQASTLAKKDGGKNGGKEALELIYEQVPDAMMDLYDACITLPEFDGHYDHTSFNVDWGPVIGFRLKSKKATKNEQPKVDETSQNQTSLLMDAPEILFLEDKETSCLSYLLCTDEWGAGLLRHPLVKWYLYLKWEKIRWFFWITFMLQIFWLSIYTCIFVVLHLDISDLVGVNCTKTAEGTPVDPDANKNTTHCFKSTADLNLNGLWHFMMVFTILEAVKEVYQMWVLKKSYIVSLENQLQIIFIIFFTAQYGILVTKSAIDTDVIASISAMTIIISGILMILQLGKTPKFGLQVAAFKKVFNSCGPHLPIFIIWFIGFGLAFWALFYNAEKSWSLGMIAIIAAMGIGELNAKENLEHFVTGSFSLPELVHVFCMLLFVIIIVTLYFNLLVGYAVTDLQVLLPKAETLQLSNKLSTIYTIETFLVSRPGRLLVAVKCWISSITSSCSRNKDEDLKKPKGPLNPLESIYVLSPSEFQSCGGLQKFKFSELPKEQLDELKKLAFKNLVKAKKDGQGSML